MLKPQSKYPFTIHTFHSCPRLNAFCTTSSFWGPSRDPASWIFSGKGMLRWESSSFTKGSQDFSKGSKFRGYCLSRPSMDGFKEKPTGNHRFSKLGKRLVCHLFRQQWLNFNYGWRPKQGSPPKNGTPWSFAVVLINTFAPSTKISTYLNTIPSTWHGVFAIKPPPGIWLHTTSSLTRCDNQFPTKSGFKIGFKMFKPIQASNGTTMQNSLAAEGPFFFFFLCVCVCPFKYLKVIKWLWKKGESW